VQFVAGWVRLRCVVTPGIAGGVVTLLVYEYNAHS
jgi:uncharacterized membrane protein